MKNLKKVFLAVTWLVVAASVSAQLNFGVKAGFNASTISGIKEFASSSSGDVEGVKLTTPYSPGFQIGIMAQYMLNEQAGLETGLYYSQIGAKTKAEATILNYYAKSEITLNPSYLQLPVTFLYKFGIGTDLYLYPQAGLYLGYGLGGQVKTSSETNIPDAEVPDDEKEDFFGDGTNRFDAGLTFGLNLQYQKFVIGLGYDLGLTKINEESASGMKDLKNANIKVTLGYFF